MPIDKKFRAEDIEEAAGAIQQRIGLKAVRQFLIQHDASEFMTVVMDQAIEDITWFINTEIEAVLMPDGGADPDKSNE